MSLKSTKVFTTVIYNRHCVSDTSSTNQLVHFETVAELRVSYKYTFGLNKPHPSNNPTYLLQTHILVASVRWTKVVCPTKLCSANLCWPNVRTRLAFGRHSVRGVDASRFAGSFYADHVAFAQTQVARHGVLGSD